MKQTLNNQLRTSKHFLDKSTEALTEEDSGLVPAEGMMSAAQQMANIAQTVDWFIDGVFGDNGFDMDFEGPAKLIMAVTSLTVYTRLAGKTPAMPYM